MIFKNFVSNSLKFCILIPSETPLKSMHKKQRNIKICTQNKYLYSKQKKKNNNAIPFDTSHYRQHASCQLPMHDGQLLQLLLMGDVKQSRQQQQQRVQQPVIVIEMRNLKHLQQSILEQQQQIRVQTRSYFDFFLI